MRRGMPLKSAGYRWFSLSGVGGHGDAAAGFLIAVFMFTGWDGTLYVAPALTA
jgi:hypothetical protein